MLWTGLPAPDCPSPGLFRNCRFVLLNAFPFSLLLVNAFISQEMKWNILSCWPDVTPVFVPLSLFGPPVFDSKRISRDETGRV